MNQIKKTLICISLIIASSCTDGNQIGQKINQLIEDHKIETIIIEQETANGQNYKKEYPIEESIIEEQFIKIEDEYINMGRIKTIKVNGKKLKITI